MPNAVEIVNELAGCSQQIFRIVTVLYGNTVPTACLVRMIVRIVNRHFMSFFCKTSRKVRGDLFKTTIMIGDSPCAKYCNLHWFFAVELPNNLFLTFTAGSYTQAAS